MSITDIKNCVFLMFTGVTIKHGMSFQKKKMKSENRQLILFHLPFFNHNIEHDEQLLFGFIDFVIIEFNKNKEKFLFPCI